MKKVAQYVLLTVIAIGLSGCVVAIGNKGGESKTNHCKTEKDINATMAEIDAVKSLHTEDARRNIYMTIAQRPHLSPEERTHLLDAAMKNLHTEDARADVLMKLAKNHAPCDPPKPESKKAKEEKTETNQ